MESRKDLAAEKKGKGYNCAQAVACTYSDFTGLDPETLHSLTDGFATGMGNMEGTCGAIVGAVTVLGMYVKNYKKQHPDVRISTAQLSKILMDRFKEKNTTVTCKDLKGRDTGVVIRQCPDCVRDAAEILEDILEKLK